MQGFIGGRRCGSTDSLGFFLGPGLPRTLGWPSGPVPLTAEDLLMPFFLTPSVGGPMTGGAGVPLAAGVAGLESEALSPLEAGAAWRVADAAGDSCDSLTSLTGDSSLTL